MYAYDTCAQTTKVTCKNASLYIFILYSNLVLLRNLAPITPVWVFNHQQGWQMPPLAVVINLLGSLFGGQLQRSDIFVEDKKAHTIISSGRAKQ